MPITNFGFGIAADKEEKNIYVIGGRLVAQFSKSIHKYNHKLDGWYTIATELPVPSEATAAKGLDSDIWIMIHKSTKLLFKFMTNTETLEAVNPINIPSFLLYIFK